MDRYMKDAQDCCWYRTRDSQGQTCGDYFPQLTRPGSPEGWRRHCPNMTAHDDASDRTYLIRGLGVELRGDLPMPYPGEALALLRQKRRAA